MSTPLRKKRANSVIWGMTALMMLGLGGYGVTNFSGGQSEMGHVGTRKITANQYANAVRQQIAAVSQQLGQQLTFEQAQSMGIDRSVLEQIVSNATLENEAALQGVSVGDAHVREKIVSAPSLQGVDGKFDRDAYGLFLKQQGVTEAVFEQSVRDEGARTLLQGAVLGGVSAPDGMADKITAWSEETRAFTLAELRASDLNDPVAAPTDAEIKAWYDAHQDAYMRPETQKISYVWLKPESLLDQVDIPDADLKAAYDQRISEFVIPEKRLVARLVYPSDADAKAAKARLDKGEVSFEALAKERGLTVDDIDLGEVSKEDLGAAGDAVFALKEPGTVGPFQSDLGPALFAMNGILAAQETTFDEAKEDLKAEIGLDRARRMVADKQNDIEDMLASGGTLADVAKDAGMEFGQIDYNSESEGGLTGYESFRKAAAALTADSFPTLEGLDDGGIFALQLDGTEPAAVHPLEEVKDKVAADWTADATHKTLLKLAEEQLAQTANGVSLDGLGLITTQYDNFARDGFVTDAPPEIAKQVFEMTAGDTKVIDAANRVFLVSLTAVIPADLKQADTAAKRDQIKTRLSQAMARDVFEMFSRNLQSGAGVSLNQAMVDAVNAQLK